MKKILIATTALVATAGMAAAELNLSGSARFGVVYDDGNAEEFGIHNRFTLNIDGSVDSDSGVRFFARVRVRGGNSYTSTSASGVSAPRVGMSVGGFTVATGNILGAIESMAGMYDGAIGLTGLGWGNVAANADTLAFGWDSFSSAGGGSNGVEVIYSSGAFTGHASYSESTELAAISLSYSFGDWTVALGHQDDGSGNDDITVGTIGGSFGNVNIGASYAEVEGDNKWRINASTSVGAGTTIAGYIADDDGADDMYGGVGFTHSLGGAVLAGGIAKAMDGDTLADLGVRFSF